MDAERLGGRGHRPAPVWMNGRGGQPEGYCRWQTIDAIHYLAARWHHLAAIAPGFLPGTGSTPSFRRWRDNKLIGEFHDRQRR